MENRFFEMNEYLRGISGKSCRSIGVRSGNGGVGVASGWQGLASSPFSVWSEPFSAVDRVLIILIENGGVDLGIPALVEKILTSIPVADAIPDSYRQRLVDYLREKIRSFTDDLLETVELSANRYNAAKPDLFGDVIILRNSTASYQELKSRLLALSNEGKIVDLFILTHGAGDYISVTGGINGQKIRQMKTENGRPLPLRSVYMMNCVGSSLNQAWIDAGAKVSSGAVRNNYLPEPTMFFFWNNWKEGQTFEHAVNSAYQRTIDLMNGAVRGFLRALPGGSLLASRIDFANLDFVKDSEPVILGQGSVTISSDALTFSQSVSSSRATKASRPRSFGLSQANAGTLSPQGIDFIKGWEGFRATMYNDPVGHCTIGYGTLLHMGNCDGRASEQPYANGISEERATELLVQKAGEFQRIVNDNVTVALNQNQNDALVSFVYNVGGGNFRRSTLLRLLNQGDYAAVPTELRKWTKARQNGHLVDLPGLVRRRAAEAELFQRPAAATTTAQSLSHAGNRPLARSLSGMDYSIPGILPVIAQPTPNTCWAAVFTMMHSWKTNRSVDIRDALTAVGARYVEMFDRDIALDSNTAAALYQDAGLVPLTSFNPSVEGWVSLLRQYGPLYVDVGYNVQNANTHAIIVRAISGDGSPDNTAITYIDPIRGMTVTLKFREFLAKYEAQSALQWPYTIVHWPAGAQVSVQNSLPIKHSYSFRSPSSVATQQSAYSIAQNPAAAVIAGIEVADAAQIGLGAVAIVQSQVSASQGSFALAYDKAQRLLSAEARAQMPGSQTSKRGYSQRLFFLSIGRLGTAEADVIVEWEGNPYGEIGTPVMRRNLGSSTEWSKSSANINISKIDRIPLPGTDPRTWPIVYSYEGTYDPLGNGHFEFGGEFEINAFGGLKFNRHEVVSRSLGDWALGGTPQDKVQKGQDVIVPVPAIPQEQIDYLRTRLP